MYLKYLKRRAEKFSRSTQDKQPELWMLPVLVGFFSMLYCDCVIANVLQAGMETVLAESLSEILQKIHGYSGIQTYHIPFLPRRL